MMTYHFKGVFYANINCMDLPTAKFKDGFIGLKDFPGQIIKLLQDNGFIYHSRVTIWKDPVIAMQRTIGSTKDWNKVEERELTDEEKREMKDIVKK